MFIDHAKIFVASGKGGNGSASFRREKYVPDGGPDGGDGGKGGDVVLVADLNLSTLQDFRYKRKYKAQDGEPGGKRKCFGKGGDDLIIRLPVGSYVKDAESGEVLADFTEHGQRIVIAKGGKGGLGNTHFANSVRQAPTFARAGQPNEEVELIIELKLLADVGLLGMPNVGKSTFLSVVSNAKPKIADYPFTTLEPNLGIVEVDDVTFVLADIPGLIEGASEGQGLGTEFLRHVERTRLLLHFVDISGTSGRDPINDFEVINEELANHSSILAERPQIVVGTKADMADPEAMDDFADKMKEKGNEVYFISAPIHEGVEALLKAVAERLQSLPLTILEAGVDPGHKLYKLVESELKVEKREDGFYVTAPWIENLIMSVNFEDIESMQYFQRTLKKRGVTAALEEAGVQEGDTVNLEEFQFEYIP